MARVRMHLVRVGIHDELHEGAARVAADGVLHGAERAGVDVHIAQLLDGLLLRQPLRSSGAQSELDIARNTHTMRAGWIRPATHFEERHPQK